MLTHVKSFKYYLPHNRAQKNVNSAIKRNEIMPFSATLIDPEMIILREVRQRKTKYHMLSLIYEV